MDPRSGARQGGAGRIGRGEEEGAALVRRRDPGPLQGLCPGRGERSRQGGPRGGRVLPGSEGRHHQDQHRWHDLAGQPRPRGAADREPRRGFDRNCRYSRCRWDQVTGHLDPLRRIPVRSPADGAQEPGVGSTQEALERQHPIAQPHQRGGNSGPSRSVWKRPSRATTPTPSPRRKSFRN